MKKTHIVSAVGAIAGASFALGSVSADTGDNPFQADDLDLSQLSTQASFGEEGKCGEGSCGEGDDEGGEGSCGEGSCGEGDEGGEGSCGEGSCGEGSCGVA